ncbi:MAG TPA: glycosyltransferase family 2 protein [Acidimicrobiia bacterium]
MSSHPSVSIIIAAASASVTLPKTLEAIAAQDYPGDIEVVVAAADASTAEAARQHAVTVVENVPGTTPAGLNLAAHASSGTFLVRVDAHSLIPPHYVSRVVETLQSTGADNVGGRQVPAGTTFTEKAIAAAMASPFGAGDARYRVGGQAGPADTVYLGAFPRRVFEEIGGYDERFVRNQDYDLNHRIRSTGGVVWFDPGLEVTYRPRSSLTALAGQYFDYGLWKRFFARTRSWSLRPRQLAPPLLVLILVASLVGSYWLPLLLWLPVAYLLALILIGTAYLPRIGAPALLMPVALAVMHVSWGVGFLVGHTSER